MNIWPPDFLWYLYLHVDTQASGLTLMSCQQEWIYGLISFKRSSLLRMTQSRASFRMASFPVSIAKDFLLKILLIVSGILRSSAVSMALVEGVVSVLEDAFVLGVVLSYLKN